MALPLRHLKAAPSSDPPPPSPPPYLAARPAWEVWLDRTVVSFAPVVDALQAGYGFAAVAVVVATAAALGLGLGSEPGVFAPFLVSVTAVALRHGIGPALVTIAASLVVTYAWFLAPLSTLAFDPAALRRLAFFRLGVFAGAGVLITLFAEAHRQTLQQLERSRRQLRAFTENEDVGLQIVDHDGRIVWADNGTARLLDYDAEEWVGHAFADFHGDPILAADVQACLAAGKAVENVRATLLRKDGATQDVLLNSNALLGDARTGDSGVLLAVLPIKTPVAVDDPKLAVSFLLERRRKAAADRQQASATLTRGDLP